MDEKIAAGGKIARIAVISPPHSSHLLAERIIMRHAEMVFSQHSVILDIYRSLFCNWLIKTDNDS